MKSIYTIILILTFSDVLACEEKTAARYVRSNAGHLVYDKATKLLWSVCSYGMDYSFSDRLCIGIAEEKTWEEVVNFQLSTHPAPFRVPNINELNSIVDHSCYLIYGSSFNKTFFNFSAGNYWSSTPNNGFYYLPRPGHVAYTVQVINFKYGLRLDETAFRTDSEFPGANVSKANVAFVAGPLDFNMVDELF